MNREQSDNITHKIHIQIITMPYNSYGKEEMSLAPILPYIMCIF